MVIHLMNGFEGPELSELAWACRNVFEICIWAHWIAGSAERLARFNQDSLIDTVSVSQAGKTFIDTSVAADTDRSYKEQVDAIHTNLLEEYGLSSEDERAKHIDITQLANEVGIGPQFRFINKLMSKFVHTTAYSVLCAPNDDMARQIGQILLQHGANVALKTLDSLNQQFADCGIDAQL